MDGNFPVLTVLGKAYLDKNKRCLALASKLLGVNVTEMGCFKKLNDFKSSEDYKAYVKANIKDNILVICNQDIKSYYNVPKGSFGRVTKVSLTSQLANFAIQCIIQVRVFQGCSEPAEEGVRGEGVQPAGV